MAWVVTSNGINWRVAIREVGICSIRKVGESDDEKEDERETLEAYLRSLPTVSTKKEMKLYINNQPGQRAAIARSIKKKSAKRGREFNDGLELLSDYIPDEDRSLFRAQGFLKCPDVPCKTLEILQRLHVAVLKDESKGSPVHQTTVQSHKGGSRSVGIGLTFFPLREAKKNPAATTEISNIRATPTERLEYQQAIEDLVAHVSNFVCREPKDLRGVDCMLSFPQQTPQAWHQDGKHPGVLGVLVYLSDGMATEYGAYPQRRWSRMRMDRRARYMKECWEATQTSPPVSIGLVTAGTVLLSDVVHIHRQPKPPTDGFRRSIFLAFDSPKTHTDKEVVTHAGFWANNKPGELEEPGCEFKCGEPTSRELRMRHRR